MTLSRRQLIGLGAAASLAGRVGAQEGQTSDPRKNRIKVAAVQMHCNLGDVDMNLEKAERWLRDAIRRGAEWIVLPEFFTSGLGRHDSMLDAHRPIDGQPAQMLKRLAAEAGVFLSGSFLAESHGDVFNTFVLVTPDGQIFQHDKDFPSTPLESSYYAAGEDEEFVRELQTRIDEIEDARRIPTRPENNGEGIFAVDGINVGCALCWEQIRYRTAARMKSANPDLLLTASCWPGMDPDVGHVGIAPERGQVEYDAWHQQVIDAPIRLAKMLGCPVVHANTCGETWSPTADKKTHYLLRFLGESQIVDGHGAVLARRPRTEGEGVVMTDISLGNVGSTIEIPDDETWTSDTTEFVKGAWYSNAGREYYLNHARPHRLLKR